MGKQLKEAGAAPVDGPETEATPALVDTLHSVDEQAGKVVLTTTRPHGTVITATLAGFRIKATVEDGHIWLNVGAGLPGSWSLTIE